MRIEIEYGASREVVDADSLTVTRAGVFSEDRQLAEFGLRHGELRLVRVGGPAAGWTLIGAIQATEPEGA